MAVEDIHMLEPIFLLILSSEIIDLNMDNTLTHLKANFSLVVNINLNV